METKSAQTVDLTNRTTVFIRLPIGGYSYAGSRQTDGRTDSDLPTKILHAPLLSPYLLHAPSISFFSILSSKQYLVRSTGHYAPYCVVFSTPLLLRPS
jgi:hypothetical protein